MEKDSKETFSLSPPAYAQVLRPANHVDGNRIRPVMEAASLAGN